MWIKRTSIVFFSKYGPVIRLGTLSDPGGPGSASEAKPHQGWCTLGPAYESLSRLTASTNQ